MEKLISLILTGLLVLLSGSTKITIEEKPNLLFIITDQQSYDALGMVGNFPFLKTPNLDKLASQGAIYESTYTKCAVCALARVTKMTGRTIGNHGIYTN